MASQNYLEVEQKQSVFSNIIASECTEIKVDASTPDFSHIPPESAICAKGKTEENEKVFINLLHHPVVPPPGLAFDMKKMIHCSSEEFLKEVPMRVVEMHIELDKAGNECKCFDVIINSNFFKELTLSEDVDIYYQFLLAFACFAVQQKYGTNILINTLRRLSKLYHGRKPFYCLEMESKASSNQPLTDDIVLKENDATSVKDSSVLDVMIPAFNNVSLFNVVTPKAGKCVMCKTKENEKIYVNLCHCDEVPQPSPVLDWQKLRNRELESLENCVCEIPMSMSGPHIEEIDETEQMCKCYDVVINSKFYYELTGSVSIKDLEFILLLACSALKVRYNILVDLSSVEIMHIRYQGYSMHAHSIQLISKAKTNAVSLKIISDEDSSHISSALSSHNPLEPQCLKVTPRAGNCVMFSTEQKGKIFVNLCHCPEVPPPSSLLDWDSLVYSTENKIPMSLGNPHVEILKGGEKCMCYDVVINSEFYYEITSSVKNDNLEIVLLLACSALELKHNFPINFESRNNLLIPYQGTEIVKHSLNLPGKSKGTENSMHNKDSKDDILVSVSPQSLLSSAMDNSNCNLFEVKPNVKAITPKPGLCVKAKTDSNEKIFINLCHHPDVPAPPPSIDVASIINSSEESLFHFPLSLGELHTEFDKSGFKCKCYDVVINSEYFKEVAKKADVRDFILVLAATGLERKYDIPIDVGTFRVLNKSYHGDKISQHFIKLQSKTNANLSLLDEFLSSGDSISMPVNDTSRLIPFPSPKITSYKLFLKSDSLLVFQGLCTGISSKSDFAVFAFNRKLTIEDKNGKILLSILLPHQISPKNALGNFKNGRLIVSMPVVLSDL